jgi:hypothetical protein
MLHQMIGILARLLLKLIAHGLPMKGSSNVFRGPSMPHGSFVVVGKVTSKGCITRRSLTALSKLGN